MEFFAGAVLLLVITGLVFIAAVMRFFGRPLILPLSIGVQRIAAVSQSFPLLAVPFFVFAGHLMNERGITDRLFKFANITLSWMAGGVAQVAFILRMLFVAGLFVAGLFIESTVLVLLLTPIFVPIIQQVGVDPVHFGILMMTPVTLGSMTSPVGVAMYTVCSLLDCKVEDCARE